MLDATRLLLTQVCDHPQYHFLCFQSVAPMSDNDAVLCASSHYTQVFYTSKTVADLLTNSEALRSRSSTPTAHCSCSQIPHDFQGRM